MIGYIITDKNYIPEDEDLLDVCFDPKSEEIKGVPIELNKKYDYIGTHEGFHINKNIWNCFINFNHDKQYHILKVDTMDDCVICIKKYEYLTHSFIATEKVTLDEISKDIIDNYKAAFQYDNIKLIAINLNCCLDILYKDRNWVIRKEVAKVANNEILDKLLDDKSSSVRAQIVRRNYKLDHFVSDSDWMVRKEVAKQGYGLDILINDNICSIRKEVAKHGYGYWKFLFNKKDRKYLKLHKIAKRAYFQKLFKRKENVNSGDNRNS